MPRARRFPLRRDGSRFIPFEMPGSLAVEFTAERSRGVDDAGTTPRASATFFKLSAEGAFRAGCLAGLAMAAIERERHTLLDARYTPLHAEG